MMTKTLRNRLIRLGSTNPELQPNIYQILKVAGGDLDWEAYYARVQDSIEEGVWSNVLSRFNHLGFRRDAQNKYALVWETAPGHRSHNSTVSFGDFDALSKAFTKYSGGIKAVRGYGTMEDYFSGLEWHGFDDFSGQQVTVLYDVAVKYYPDDKITVVVGPIRL